MGDQLLMHYCTQPPTEESLQYMEGLINDGHANVNFRSITGSSPLFEAIRCSNEFETAPTINMLLRKGADVDNVELISELMMWRA